MVKIGIAYGSPVREVTDLLLEVADRHGLVEDDPKPTVQFEDFGSDCAALRIVCLGRAQAGSILDGCRQRPALHDQ